MSKRVVTIHSYALVWAAVDLMRTRKLRHLPVVDRGGRLVGVVTDRDLRQVMFDPSIQERMGGRPEALKALAVREIMTWGVITVRPETDVREAARLMRERKIGAVPAVERQAVVGILTETDVLDALVRILKPGRAAKVKARTRRYDYGFPIRMVLDPWRDAGGGD